VIFPGGADRRGRFSTCRYLLDPANQNLPFPGCVHGPGRQPPIIPADSPLIAGDMGSAAQARYKVIIG